ncbi:MAG: arylsulfatase, partial [Actinobacteria bacterium]|nr:arylsulfatase [Actinomycetota bacterium]
RGEQRDQFVFVADVAPTIYDLVGVTPPDVYGGIDQLPVTGRSFASVVDHRDAPAANTIQYFEMAGSRALVAGEWKAVCKHTPGGDYDTEQWELYHLASDWSECSDLAAERPEKLAELQELWWVEAERHGVLPLDDRMIELFGARFRPNSPHAEDRRYVYRPPMSPLPAQAGAAVGGRSFDITAHVTRRPGEDGVLYATGTENSGISLFVQNDRLVVDYNAFDDHSILESDIVVPDGASTLSARFRRSDGRAGAISIDIDGIAAGRIEVPLYMRMISSVGGSIGYDHGSAVSSRYQAPFEFAGTLHEVVVQLVAKQDQAGAEAEARAEMSKQ